MRAAILTEQHRPLVVDDVELPDELRFGQVLVDLAYTGICGSQIGEIDGVKGEDRHLPHLLGHEGSGTVAATGPGVSTVGDGDRVVLHWMRGDGMEGEPPAYRWRGRTVNAGWVTTFNERAVISENRVTKIPDDFDLALAPLLGCAVTTGLGVVNNDAQLKIGQSLVVFGAGGIGLSVIQGASMVCGDPIVAVDIHDARLAMARELGATHAINSTAVDPVDAVGAIIGAHGADVVVDNTGNPEVIECAYRLTAPRGRTVLVGVPPRGREVSLYTLPLHFGKVLRGSHGGSAEPALDIPRYVRLSRRGALDLRRLITDRYTLDQINDAIADLRAGRVAGRAIVAVGPELNNEKVA